MRKGKWEFLGGQSWSMLTPNRKGISPLPGDIFYSASHGRELHRRLDLDRASRASACSITPSDKVTFGSRARKSRSVHGRLRRRRAGRASRRSAPSPARSWITQSNAQTTPNLHPDIIAKLAFDPASRVHFESPASSAPSRSGIPATSMLLRPDLQAAAAAPSTATSKSSKNFRLITNNYWSDGGGRYLFGNAPDLMMRSDGSISPIHSGGTIEGFEAT